MTFAKKPRIVKHWDSKESCWIFQVSVSLDGIPKMKDAERIAATMEEIATKEEGQGILTQ